MVRPRALAVLRLLDGQVAWLGPVENPVHVGSGAPKQISQVRSIGHMTSPSVTGSVAELKTMGRVLVACLAARAVGVPPPLELPFSRSVFNHDVAALDIPRGHAVLGATFPAGCASAASGAATRPPAMITMKVRRGISGKQVESIWPSSLGLAGRAGTEGVPTEW